MSKKQRDPHFPGIEPIWRLNREWLFTEKADGTNGLIAIADMADRPEGWPDPLVEISIVGESVSRGVWAGSKNQWLAIGQDNFGFAGWVRANAFFLVLTLGEGIHRGEWWGSGIQRGYGLPKGEKRFSLFNVSRWVMEDTAIDGGDYLASATKIPYDAVPGLDVVPYLGSTVSGLTDAVEARLYDLVKNGSKIVPGFMRPEGIVAFQPSSLISFKVTIENDGVPKGLVNRG